MEAKVSVRGLVEFILRTGDIDNRIGSFTEQAMQEGGRIHRMIQKRMGADYRSEVPLAFVFQGEYIDLTVEGRADGIIENESGFTVDEIKSTYADVMKFKEAKTLHLAQAKCYAYIVGKQNDLEKVKVRITYCNIETEEIRYFHETCSMKELEVFFTNLCKEYEKWARLEAEWKQERDASIEALEFPFFYRDGQYELVKQVYATIFHKKKLYLEAPTGVGKTISTVFPAVQAMGRQMADKLFYLTAKTITRTVASDTFDLLRENGLRFKSVILTAKEKICVTGETDCNPAACPYAGGHYDRINDAMYDVLTHAYSYTRDTILAYADKHRVCPFELSLDLSLFCDAIVGDYNYAFDPRAKLKRFFGDEAPVDKKYIFLIDEAHNLVDRAREMYSAVLVKEDFLALKKLTQSSVPLVSKRAEACNKEMLSLKRQCEGNMVEPPLGALTEKVLRLYAAMEKTLKEREEDPKKLKAGVLPQKDRTEFLEYYFAISHFLEITELLDDMYVPYAGFMENGNFFVKLFCVNPRNNLKECMDFARSSVLFSATLLPIQYYKYLLAGTQEDYEVYAKSVFDPKNRGLFVAKDVTSKYTRRSFDEYKNIACYIHEITICKKGNYMVFFPSYRFLQDVYAAYEMLYLSPSQEEILIQSTGMKEEEKETFLERFKDASSDRSLIGFCVMGGIFSEGIDLKSDSLIGAIIVGTGLPQISFETDLIKSYFDSSDQDGFDFAYRFPGMNKVLQAAGRVIRTESDVGIVALLDERFLQSSYLRMFPLEWESYSTVFLKNVSDEISEFWNSRLT